MSITMILEAKVKVKMNIIYKNAQRCFSTNVTELSMPVSHIHRASRFPGMTHITRSRKAKNHQLVSQQLRISTPAERRGRQAKQEWFAFMKLPSEIRCMIWKAAMPDFSPCHFKIDRSNYYEPPLPPHASPADQAARTHRFTLARAYLAPWALVAPVSPAPTARSVAGQLEPLYHPSRWTYSLTPMRASDVSRRIPTIQSLLLSCREAQCEIQRLLPDILPLSDGAMRFNATDYIVWLEIFYAAMSSVMYESPIEYDAPGIPATRDRGFSFDRDWNQLVRNIGFNSSDWVRRQYRVKNLDFISQLSQFPKLKSFFHINPYWTWTWRAFQQAARMERGSEEMSELSKDYVAELERVKNLGLDHLIQRH